MTNSTTEQKSTIEQVTDAPRSAAAAAGAQAGAVATTAQNEATSVARDARQQAQRLAGDARSHLRQQADEQSQRLARTLRDIGGQLDGMASGNSAPSGFVADVTQQAASSVHQMAQTLDQKGAQGVIADVKRFARGRPGVFVIGALGAGLVAGRLIRALDTSAVMDAAKPSQQPDGLASPGVTGVTAAEFGGAPALNRPTEF